MNYRVKCTQAFAYQGRVIAPGKIVEVDKVTAEDLLRRGRVVNAPATVVPAEAAAPKAGVVRGKIDPSYFAEMSKADVAKVAKEMGINLPANATKAQLVEAICNEEVETDAGDVTPAEG